MSPIALSAKQIKDFDELNNDKMAIDKTLSVALTYHSNLANENAKRERELWNDLIDTYRLSKDVSYKIKPSPNGPVIVENVEE
jgi:hypothetical protein